MNEPQDLLGDGRVWLIHEDPCDWPVSWSRAVNYGATRLPPDRDDAILLVSGCDDIMVAYAHGEGNALLTAIYLAGAHDGESRIYPANSLKGGFCLRIGRWDSITIDAILDIASGVALR